MQNINLQPVKGFRDFYPESMAFRSWLFGKMRKVSRLFGYQEYEGPILEPLSLYETKSGEELVKKQTFTLTDRGSRKLALRPEMTPTLARMVAAKQYELPLPIRWFSIGPRFRYEMPQKGRAREFYQWDVDLVGINSPEADAEIIALACRFFQDLGLSSKEVVIKVNNRRLMDFKLSLLEIPKKLTSQVFRAIDKQAVNTLQNQGLPLSQIKELKKILTNRDFSFESEELTQAFSTLKDLGVSGYVEFDPTVVRGLDYYTGTVFEARDRKGKFRAILGGGRYDNLIDLITRGKVSEPPRDAGNLITLGRRRTRLSKAASKQNKLSGVGFACGDMVMEEVLKVYNKYPPVELINPNPTRVLVTVFDESTFRDSLKVFTILLRGGINTEIYPENKVKLDKQLKYADRKGIPYVIILGPEEIAKNQVTLKNLAAGKQETADLNILIKKYLTI